MPPAYDRSNDLLNRYENNRSEEELSDKKRVQIIQDEEIGEFEKSHTVDKPCSVWA